MADATTTHSRQGRVGRLAARALLKLLDGLRSADLRVTDDRIEPADAEAPSIEWSVEAVAEWLQGFDQDARDQIALMMAVTRRVHRGAPTRFVTQAGREVRDALLKLANAINDLPTVEGIHHQER